jgi:hypothetical protein
VGCLRLKLKVPQGMSPSGVFEVEIKGGALKIECVNADGAFKIEYIDSDSGAHPPAQYLVLLEGSPTAGYGI